MKYELFIKTISVVLCPYLAAHFCRFIFCQAAVGSLYIQALGAGIISLQRIPMRTSNQEPV